jgi:hypothetical protein
MPSTFSTRAASALEKTMVATSKVAVSALFIAALSCFVATDFDAAMIFNHEQHVKSFAA